MRCIGPLCPHVCPPENGQQRGPVRCSVPPIPIPTFSGIFSASEGTLPLFFRLRPDRSTTTVHLSGTDLYFHVGRYNLLSSIPFSSDSIDFFSNAYTSCDRLCTGSHSAPPVTTCSLNIVEVLFSLCVNFHRHSLKMSVFTHFLKKRWVLFYYRGQKLGSRVNFLHVLKYPEYENRIFWVSYIYVCMNFVIRTSLSVFDGLSWNLDIMCKYGWNCAK